MCKPILIGLILLQSLTGWSQETISSQGNHDVLTDVQVSWTLGELAIDEFRGNEIIVTQGIHQPSITIIKLGIEDELGNIRIYPNPTRSIISIEILGDEQQLDYSLIDPTGVQHESKGSLSGKATVDLSGYPSGMYILKVLQGQKMNFFKILKSN